MIALAVLVLSACGDTESEGPPAPGATDDAPVLLGDQVDHTVIEVLSASAAGAPTSAPAYVGDRLALLRYLQQFRSNDHGSWLADEIEATVTAVPPKSGYTLVAAIVGVGCEPIPPENVQVRLIDDRLDITGTPTRTDIECVVARTSVAVVQVPKDVVRLPKDETRTPDGSGQS